MRHFARVAPIAILLTLAAASISAQEITPANLPADTTLVLFSHSRDKIQAAAPSNPMVKAWYSPEYGLIRTLLVQYFIGQMTPKPGSSKFTITPENTDKLLSVFQNSLVFGISGPLNFTSLAQDTSGSPIQIFQKSGVFLILDTTGKDPQVTQLWPALVAALPKEIAHTHYDVGGISIEKFAGPNQTTFTARVGSRFIWSNHQNVIEDLIGRLKSGAPSGNSLAENTDFQHCQSHPAPGAVLDLFYRFPDFSKLPVRANPQVDTQAMLNAMSLNSLHAVCGNMSMTQDGEVGRWMILADTSQGPVLTWLGSNHSQFETLSLVSPSTSSVAVGTFDLQAFYKTLKTAVAAAMPGRQQASVDLVEGMVSMQIGMPLTDALGIFRGEFGSITVASQSADPTKVIALTISNPQRIMDLIHKLAPKQISDETQEGGVTYFKTAAQVPTGTATPQTPATDSFIALTPQFLLVSSDKQVLHDFVARAGSSQTTGGVASLLVDPDVRRLRAMMPAEILGLSITDYSSGSFQKEMTKTFTDAQSQDKSKTTPEEIQLLQALSQFPIAKFMGGIHWGVSTWWRDSDGIHFETRMQ
jgi:hypothetical protein